MPTIIEWMPLNESIMHMTITDTRRARIGEARHEENLWWLYVDGERASAPCATIEHLRIWVREHVDQLLVSADGERE